MPGPTRRRLPCRCDRDTAPCPPPRKAARRRKPPRVLSEGELHDLRLARSWKQGERYSRNGWVRRPPPRFRATGPRDDSGVALMRAFYRGYDAMTRSRRWRHRGVKASAHG